MSAISLQTFFIGNAGSADLSAAPPLQGDTQSGGPFSLTEAERRAVEFGALFAIHVEPQTQAPVLPAGTETAGIQPVTPELPELPSLQEIPVHLQPQGSLTRFGDNSHHTDTESLQDIGLLPSDVRASNRPAIEFDSFTPDSAQLSALHSDLATDLRALKDPIGLQSSLSGAGQIKVSPQLEGHEAEETATDVSTTGLLESQFRDQPAEAGQNRQLKKANVATSDSRIAGGPTVEWEREPHFRQEEINPQEFDANKAALMDSIHETPDEPVRVHASDLQDFITQEVHANRVQSTGTNRQSITIRLDPPELGEVTIEFSSNADGLSLHIKAANSRTLELVQAVTEEINAGEMTQNDSVFSQTEFSLSAGTQSDHSEQEQDRPQVIAAEPVEVSEQPTEDSGELNIVV